MSETRQEMSDDMRSVPWSGFPSDSSERDGVALIAAERRRQVEEEGWTADHDDEHDDGSLALAGACYAMHPNRVHLRRMLNSARGADEMVYQYDYSRAKPEQVTWPWENEWYKPGRDPIRNLVKAGALIAAEIDRLQREAP